MALCKCPECGKEGVSESARSCPNCGFDIRAYQKTLKKKKTRDDLRQIILDFLSTKLGKTLAITFVVGFLLVCIAVYAVNVNKNPEILLIPACYYVIMFLSIGHLMKRIFDDAAVVATIVCSPMMLFIGLFVLLNEIGWTSLAFVEWGAYGGMLVSILIFEYKLIRALE